MQFQVRVKAGAAFLGFIVLAGLFTLNIYPALAKTQTKKHPKGFVHDTAGDGVQTPAPSAVGARVPLPKWQQYDAGGLYYYYQNQPEKARQYWMEALKLAEVDVPRERAIGLKPQTADACCKLCKHLLYFIDDAKFRPKSDASYGVNFAGSGQGPSSSQASTNPAKYQLDNIKASLRQMYQDWDWYERVCNFADRAIGKQRDCLRAIYSQREIFERRIVMTRQQGQLMEQARGIDLKHSDIDVRPLRWGGIEGGGNPMATPGANQVPVKYRGGAQSGSLD
jgi:hypothetical protein